MISAIRSFPRWFALTVCIFAGTLGTTAFAQPAADSKDTVLPPGFQPPRAIPPVMTYTKELITPGEVAALDRELRRGGYTLVFNKAELNAQSKALVSTWAKLRLYSMTLKSNREKLHELRSEVMRDIGYAARSSKVAEKQAIEFRTFVCQEVIALSEDLLKNNFHVRLNTAIILANLNLTDYDRIRKIDEKAFVPAAKPLMDILKAKTGGGLDEQLEAVKVPAAIGLGRIGLLGPPSDLNVNLKTQIAKAIIAELKNSQAHPWYQKRLADALGEFDLLNDPSTGQPILVQALGEVLVDKKRPFRVRARAARALGRAVLPPSLNVEKTVFEILQLEHEMAQAYQKDPNQFYWLDCFQDVYFAFHAVDEQEVDRFGVKRPPGLNRKKLPPIVTQAYQQLIPIASHVVTQDRWLNPGETLERPDNAPIPDQLITDLGTWLKNNTPSSHQLAPNLPALDPEKPAGNAGNTGE